MPCLLFRHKFEENIKTTPFLNLYQLDASDSYGLLSIYKCVGTVLLRAINPQALNLFEIPVELHLI